MIYKINILGKVYNSNDNCLLYEDKFLYGEINGKRKEYSEEKYNHLIHEDEF